MRRNDRNKKGLHRCRPSSPARASWAEVSSCLRPFRDQEIAFAVFTAEGVAGILAYVPTGLPRPKQKLGTASAGCSVSSNLIVNWIVVLFLAICTGCAANKSRPAEPPTYGQVKEADLAPCAPLVEDAGNAATDTLTSDAANQSAYVECQESHGALSYVVRRLIQAGLLELVR